MSEPARTVIAGASLVLPDRVASDLSLVVDGTRIGELSEGLRPVGEGDQHVAIEGGFIVPGWVDVHVHGAAGVDVLDGPGAVAEIAAMLPRWGVTAFCPTSTACAPGQLDEFLTAVSAARRDPRPGSARVLPAHLESNFINPEYRGAQPLPCLRTPAGLAAETGSAGGTAFTARDVLAVIDRHRADVGIVTLAPELEGAGELIRSLAAAGVRVSLGHSGATFEQAQAGFAAGARQATHLFNRMRPMTHREPGLVGAVLSSQAVAAELVCDGWHVHAAAVRIALAAKGPARILAITDGTAGAGLPAGTRTRLGGQVIVAGADVARLEDGTTAGSVATMERVFSWLVAECGLDLVTASHLCSTTAARELGLTGLGVLAPGAWADFVVLDRGLRVIECWVNGRVAG
jgi:N-acetylglucosamine-6-phosphate deacetylase